jgi:ankyrin repeat protein
MEYPQDQLSSLATEELQLILAALDIASLLHIPACCRGLRASATSCEDCCWQVHLRVAEEAAKVMAVKCCFGQTEANVDPAMFTTSPLSSKTACRLRRYANKHLLPSLPDALRCASDRNHEGMVPLLLQARADPNVSADSGAFGVGFTQVGAFPLHLAAKRSNLAVLDMLLGAGANINVADQNGRTALIVASASGQASAAQWLVTNGAAIDATSHYGYTALHQAALLPRYEIMEFLLLSGASATLCDREGQTAVHLVLKTLPRRVDDAQLLSCDPSGHGDEYCYSRSISHGYNHRSSVREVEHDALVKDTVELLLRHGANANACDGHGRTAADVLVQKGRLDLQKWLQEKLQQHQPNLQQLHVGKRTSIDRPASMSGEKQIGCLAGFLQAWVTGCLAGWVPGWADISFYRCE